jgi:RimJ/RimL family protein N-acetyltransferase
MEQGAAREFILPYSLEQHQTEFAKESVRYLSIDVGEKLAGFFILALDDGRSVEFRRIVIAEPGRGLGSMALKLVETYCTETLKRNRIWLDVFESNGRARHVYEKYGFTSFGNKTHGDRTLVLYELLADNNSEYEPQSPRVGPCNQP